MGRAPKYWISRAGTRRQCDQEVVKLGSSTPRFLGVGFCPLRAIPGSKVVILH